MQCTIVSDRKYLRIIFCQFHFRPNAMECKHLLSIFWTPLFLTFCFDKSGQSVALTAKFWTLKRRHLYMKEAWGWEAHQDRCNLPKSFQIYAQLPKTQRTERPSTGTRGPDGSPDFWSHIFAPSSSSPTCRKQPGKVPCQGGAGRYWQDGPGPGGRDWQDGREPASIMITSWLSPAW